MPEPPPSSADPDRADADRWPWRCLGCGTTIYHDGELCRDCVSAHRRAHAGRGGDASDGFLEWVCEEPVSAFVLKVSVVAGIELALTSLWLRLALSGFVEYGSVVPIVG